jgi:hypothetical protein
MKMEIDVDTQMTTEIARPLGATVDRHSGAGTWNTGWSGWFCIGLWKYIKASLDIDGFLYEKCGISSLIVTSTVYPFGMGDLEWKKSHL